MGYVGSGVLWGMGWAAGTSGVMALYGYMGIVDVGV